MVDPEWQGGKKEQRLYRKVRAEKQKVIRKKYDVIQAHLNERGRRLWAGSGERAGTQAGRRERQPGKGLLEAIETIVVNPATRGDPMRPLKWTSKSRRKISTELQRQGWQVSAKTVGKILRGKLDYSLQGLQKTREGASHPDRDAQFQYLNQQCQDFQHRGQPGFSVDAKKKELIGDFQNGGREWQPAGKPQPVRVHDFEDKQLGKGIPYGVLDQGRNEGGVSVGIHYDTAQFAVASIHQWWMRMGGAAYPQAQELLITADAGGSNGYRTKLWKRELQQLADETGLGITVCHFPPGTSKWNKIEHRMFCHITENWRGRPLTSLDVIVNLISNTTTRTGLVIHADWDINAYAKGIRVSKDEMTQVQVKPASFHGEWNYTIVPRTPDMEI